MTGRGVRVPDEPSNSELAWRLDDVRRMLADLVGRAEYSANQTGIDLRFTRTGEDIQELRRQHDSDVEKLHTRISDHAKADTANRQSWRGIVYTGIIPAVLVGTGILVNWLISHGGH